MTSSYQNASERGHKMELTTKRDMIQAVLDDEREPWIIMKPSRQDPWDPESLCIFENPAAQTEARAEIPLAWFQGRASAKIRDTIEQSLQHAKPKLKSFRRSDLSDD
jgi:hypothetical protein